MCMEGAALRGWGPLNPPLSAWIAVRRLGRMRKRAGSLFFVEPAVVLSRLFISGVSKGWLSVALFTFSDASKRT